MPFDEGLNAGNKIITDALQSPNYAQGSSGWTINRDGTAEFQNVLVRGTITGSKIIGSTITGGTIVGGIFKSSNFDNTAHTGFEFNATSAADTTATPPVPQNTMQIYSAFNVGPTNGNFLALSYAAGAAAVQFFTGNVADSGSAAGFGVSTFTQPISGRTISQLVTSSALENGAVTSQMFPSGGTTAADFPGEVVFGTNSVTAPSGWDGTKGRFLLGSAASDIWQLVIANENSVISGSNVGHPGLVVGDIFTPASRLLISPSEILSITGGASPTTETLFLNTNNAQSVAGGIVNPTLRQVSVVSAGPFTPTGAYGTAFGTLTNVICPASGTITLWMRMTVTGSAATTATSFIAGCPNVLNVTSSTTVFAATDNRACEVDGSYLTAANGGIVTVMTQIVATGLGNPGDNLTITALAHQNVAGAYTIKKVELGIIPSM